jgi:prophage regulatory protein
MQEDLQIIREPERFRMTGLSRVQFWRLERAGQAPKRVPLGPNSVGWLKHEVEHWILARAALRQGGR